MKKRDLLNITLLFIFSIAVFWSGVIAIHHISRGNDKLYVDAIVTKVEDVAPEYSGDTYYASIVKFEIDGETIETNLYDPRNFTFLNGTKVKIYIYKSEYDEDLPNGGFDNYSKIFKDKDGKYIENDRSKHAHTDFEDIISFMFPFSTVIIMIILLVVYNKKTKVTKSNKRKTTKEKKTKKK